MKGKQLGEVFDDFFANRGKLEKSISVPGKDAKPEEVEAFLDRMGIPKSAEGYGIEPGMIPGPDKETQAAAAKEISEFCKSIGLTKSQGLKVLEQYAGIIKGVEAAGQNRIKDLAGTFDNRLLKDTGDEKAAGETKQWFKRALVALGDKGLVKELEQSGMLYSTAFVRALADIWKAGNREPPIPNAAQGREEPRKEALVKSEQFNKMYGRG